MNENENDRARANISAIVNEIADGTKALAAVGIDAREPGDREAYDIISRIERRLRQHKEAPAA